MEPNFEDFPIPPPPPPPKPAVPPKVQFILYKANDPVPWFTFQNPISCDDIKCRTSKMLGAGFYKVQTVEGNVVMNTQKFAITKNDKKCPVKGHCSI